MYAEDGQLHTFNSDLVSLEMRISLVVNSANAWYENNRIIANPRMLLGNTEHNFYFSRLSKDLGLGIEKKSLLAWLSILNGASKFWMPNTD